MVKEISIEVEVKREIGLLASPASKRDERWGEVNKVPDMVTHVRRWVPFYKPAAYD